MIHFVHAHHGDYGIRFFRCMEKLLNKDFALNCTWKRCLERKLVSKIAKKKYMHQNFRAWQASLCCCFEYLEFAFKPFIYHQWLHENLRFNFLRFIWIWTHRIFLFSPTLCAKTHSLRSRCPQVLDFEWWSRSREIRPYWFQSFFLLFVLVRTI